MNQRLNLTLALAAGLVGGMMSHFLAPTPVLAQAQTLAPKEIRAQTFVLVDSRGVPLGLMGFDPGGKPVIKLVDERGHVIWSAGQALNQLAK
jgi:hypothetical protein